MAGGGELAEEVGPALADDGMNDVVEDLAVAFVVEDNFAECGAVDCRVGIEDPGAEGTNDFSVSWSGGPPLLSMTNAGSFGYIEYHFKVIGTGSDNVTFLISNDPAYYYLDNVSVEPLRPAPMLSHLSLGVLGLLLFAVGTWVLRQRKPGVRLTAGN